MVTALDDGHSPEIEQYTVYWIFIWQACWLQGTCYW